MVESDWKHMSKVDEKIGSKNPEIEFSSVAVNLLGAVGLKAFSTSKFEELVEAGLQLICEALDWHVGHAFFVQKVAAGENILRSSGIWYLKQPELHAEFKRLTESYTPKVAHKPLVPQWRSDVRNYAGFVRGTDAQTPLNIRAAFNLPVISNGELVAFLEFFNVGTVPRDEAFLKIAEKISLHFAKAYEAAELLKGRDISSIMSAESMLNDRMLALSEMARGISHEINNPMTIAMGHLGLLRGNLAKRKIVEPSIDNSLDKMGESLARVANVVKSMRLFCKDASDAPMEKLLVADVISAAISHCASIVSESKSQIKWVPCSEQNLAVESMGDQLIQALASLIFNALDAVKTYDAKWVEIRTTYSENWVKISVADSGTGIPLHVQARMMDPFFTTKQVGQGSGLGLSSAKGMVESHGGKLHYEEAAANTTFVIDLPRVVPQ
jgi:signal transduction histidine kinase